ncbi:PKD domain containing protein [Porphyromonadaceae bacterium W3.11]|nr:PKD domain containing protein [Porphyromonadaceae bacterium W3.11]
MKKKTFQWSLILGLLLSLSLFGCSSDDRINDLENELNKLKEQIDADKAKAEKEKQETEANNPFIKLALDKDEIALNFYPGEPIKVKVDSKGLKDIVGISSNPTWTVSYDDASQMSIITAPVKSTAGASNIIISGVNDKGQVFRGVIACTLNDYSSPYGTFILNEGSVWSTPSEMGSLIYINPREAATANVYKGINGRAIGSCPQDMFLYNDKYFVISQNTNPNTDGRLTIFDANTLEKRGYYSTELSELNNPTHVAVVDDTHIYIRDEKGIWLFDTAYSANKLTLIEGTKGARKNVMAVSHNKVFFSKNKDLKVIDSKTNSIVYEHSFDGKISGIINADKDHIYVSSYEKNVGVIRKINTESYEVVQENMIGEEYEGKLLQMSFAAAPGISAKGDTIYYSSLGQKIYRHIFSTNSSKLMVDIKEELNPEHKVTYNTAQVHPVTGHVYFNTLKGFGQDYKTNTIYRFDMTGDKGKLLNRWENLSRFPAGIFFPPAK